MGIEGFGYLLKDLSYCTNYTENKLSHYSGKIIALDASQYLFRAKVPRNIKTNQNLTCEDLTSPLLRTFKVCAQLLSNGIRPIYVFDGQSPKLKSPVLKVRKEKREEAKINFEKAEKTGNTDLMTLLKPKLVKVVKDDVKNCKELLKLMGVPYVHAPSEAEATCAALVESGAVYAAATQDSDALTFGTKILLRNFNLSDFNKKNLIQEIHLDKVLNALQVSFTELVDFSILLGCDYCKGLSGLGAHRALELVHRYHTIENILENLDKKRFPVPDEWSYKEARDTFLKPKVANWTKPFIWKKPDIDGVMQFLQNESQFSEKETRSSLENVSHIVVEMSKSPIEVSQSSPSVEIFDNLIEVCSSTPSLAAQAL